MRELALYGIITLLGAVLIVAGIARVEYKHARLNAIAVPLEQVVEK